jgi:hypothetical protein
VEARRWHMIKGHTHMRMRSHAALALSTPLPSHLCAGRAATAGKRTHTHSQALPGLVHLTIS